MKTNGHRDPDKIAQAARTQIAHNCLAPGTELLELSLQTIIERFTDPSGNKWLRELPYNVMAGGTEAPGTPEELSPDELLEAAEAAKAKSRRQAGKRLIDQEDDPTVGLDIDNILEQEGGPPAKAQRSDRNLRRTSEGYYECPWHASGCSFNTNSEAVLLEHYKNNCTVGGPSAAKTENLLKKKFTEHEIIRRVRQIEAFSDDNK